MSDQVRHDRTKIDWAVTEEQRAQIEPLLSRALVLIPKWLGELYIQFDAHMDDGLLRIGVQDEYRMAHITVASAWFSETEDARRRAIVHEIIHVHTRGVSATWEALLTATTEADTPLRKWAEEQYRRAEEMCVVDLAYALDALLFDCEGRAGRDVHT